jgi:hypothetical protein
MNMAIKMITMIRMMTLGDDGYLYNDVDDSHNNDGAVD